MKQFITPDQLLALNATQKSNLMDLWLPQVNTLAMARICKDVIHDEYDNIVFVIGEVLVTEGRNNLVLRRYRLLDESFFDENKELFENEGDFELEYSEPEQYFNKEDCMPLPGIGQMIEWLSHLRYGQDGFSISIPAARKLPGDKDFVVMNSNELEFEEEELCDALWNALVGCL
ncbi:MAG: hypothetical protein KBA53_03345 [Thermoclostridium sp.]|nr:hypothetical protein [Thermoclostridium sp.]